MDIQVPLKELQSKKIFLATPMYGGQCHGMYTRSLTDLVTQCMRHGIQLQIYYLFNESLITRARNYCCDEFLRSDATHLLFIDSDISFSAADVLSMLAMTCLPDNTYDIIGGPYPKKCISWEKIRQAVDKGFGDPQNPRPELRDVNILEHFVGDYVFNLKHTTNEIKISEPLEVLETGTGFMMITRKAFEIFDKAYPDLTFLPDHIRTEHFDGSRPIMMYFQADRDIYDPTRKYLATLNECSAKAIAGESVDVIATVISDALKFVEEESKKYSKRYLSEDYWFCQKVAKAGGGIWFCPWMQTQHVGSYIFGGSLADLAMIGAAATADAGQLRKKGAPQDGKRIPAQQVAKPLQPLSGVLKADIVSKKYQKTLLHADPGNPVPVVESVEKGTRNS